MSFFFLFFFDRNSLRQFQIRPIYFQTLPVCQPCLCLLNVSDGFYVSKKYFILYNPKKFF